MKRDSNACFGAMMRRTAKTRANYRPADRCTMRTDRRRRMVTKMVAKTVAAPPVAFPDAPKRDDMQNTFQLYLTAQIAALRKRLQELEDRKPPELRRGVFVMSEMPVRPVPTRPNHQVLRSRLDGGVRRRRVHHHPRQRLRDSASGRAAGLRARGGVQDYGRARRHHQARRLRGFENRGVLAHRPVGRRMARSATSRGPARTRRQVRPRSAYGESATASCAGTARRWACSSAGIAAI